MIVIILLAPIIFTLNSNEANESERWIVQNEYAEFYGGVSMNMTFDDYIASYNAAVMDLKEKEGLEKYNSREVGRNMAKLNTISRSDFEEVSQWDDGTVDYGMSYNKRGLTGGLGGGDASLRIGVDKKTGYVQFVGLDVTDDIFNGSDYWSYEIPYYIFNFIDDEKYVDMFNSIDEGRGFVYKNDTVYAKEKAPRKTKEGYTIEYMVLHAQRTVSPIKLSILCSLHKNIHSRKSFAFCSEALFACCGEVFGLSLLNCKSAVAKEAVELARRMRRAAG